MATAKPSKVDHGEPKYPYTTKPGSLRKFLQQIPTRPKPPKIVTNTLQTWGFKDTNDTTVLRVLKAIGLLSDAGEPTDAYAAFMRKDSGPAALGTKVRAAYKDLFDHVADPARASNEDLVNFFNIHSGGSVPTINFQVQTFKALADNATFGPTDQARPSMIEGHGGGGPPDGHAISPPGKAALHVDLHIHLPENKSRADYDAIFASIAEHLLGKNHEWPHL